MRLEEYLNQLKKHKETIESINVGDDEKRDLSSFTSNFGMYDNYTILLRAKLGNVRDFLKSRKYQIETNDGNHSELNNPQELGSIQIFAGLEFANLIHMEEFDPNWQDTMKQLERKYTLTVMINPNNDVGNGHYGKPCAMMAIDVIDYILKKKVPACFPTSMGWKNLGDLSEIVYYDPKL